MRRDVACKRSEGVILSHTRQTVAILKEASSVFLSSASRQIPGGRPHATVPKVVAACSGSMEEWMALSEKGDLRVHGKGDRGGSLREIGRDECTTGSKSHFLSQPHTADLFLGA